MKKTFLSLALLMCVGSNVYGMDGGPSSTDFDQYFDAVGSPVGSSDEDVVVAPAVPSLNSASSSSPSAAPIVPAVPVLASVVLPADQVSAPVVAPNPVVAPPTILVASLAPSAAPTYKLAWYSNSYLKYGALCVVAFGAYKAVRYYKNKKKENKAEANFDYKDDEDYEVALAA